MLVGINEAYTVSFQTHLSSPDVMTMGLLADIPNYQRSLSADYVPGSNRLEFAGDCHPWYFPNGLLVGSVLIPTTSGPMVVPIKTFAKHTYLLLDWKGDTAGRAAFEALHLQAGHPIDLDGSRWFNVSTNPADWAMNEYILPDSRRTGFPEGLRPGQRIRFNVIDPTRIPLPGGDWTITAEGSGTIELAMGYRDRTTQYASIAITDGVPSGPMTIIGSQFNALRVEFTASDPANPLHDLRIIMPGAWPGDLDSFGRGYEGKTFVQIYAEHADDPTFFLPHPDHIRDASHFVHARQVDAQTTILGVGSAAYHGIVHPSDRALPTFGIGKHEAGLGGATPWEWLIEVTNLADQDFYLCTSHEWTDETIVAFCDVFKAKAKPRSRLLVEYSCETWNFSFGEYYGAVILGSAFFTPRAVESIAFSAGKATVRKAKHGYADGDSIQVYGASEAGYNGTFAISGATADTFQYTPSPTPGHSPASPTNVGRPGAFKVGSARTTGVSSFRFVWSDDPSYYTYSGYRFTTSTPGVIARNDVVAVCNVDGTGVDGFYLVDQPPGFGADEFLINLPFQCIHHPVLDPVTGFTTYPPIAGREIQVAVVGSPNPSAEAIQTASAMSRWSGYRTGTTFRLIQEQFPDDLDRLTAVVAGFQAIPSMNQERMEAFMEAFGGHLPPVSETTLHVATYHEDFSLDHRAAFVGDMKPLGSIVVSGGVATATVATYRSTWPDENYANTHGWATGDQITIQNVAADGVAPGLINGKFAMTSTGPGTFTVSMPGVANGPLIGFGGPMFAIKDNSKGIQLTGRSRSGHDVTYTAPGHFFTVGQQVGIAGVNTAVHEDVFPVKAATATTFTVEVDCDFDPEFPGGGRGNAFVASALSIYPASVSAYIDTDYYHGVIDSLVSVASQSGATAGLYETGTHYSEQDHAKFVPWVGGIVKASQRTQPMHDAILKSMALHKSRGIRRYTYYTMTRPWGEYGEHFGVNQYQGDMRSRKWTGLLAGVEAYGSEHPADAPATAFTMTAPQPHRYDLPGGYGSVSPDGVLEADTVVTLSDGGAGGTFTPPTLGFAAGSTSGRPFTYAPPAPGRRTLTATPSPPLGSQPTAISTALDADGNPGNATVLVDDDFHRSDGPVGNGWVANGVNSASIAGQQLSLVTTSGADFTQIATVIYRAGVDIRDGQVRYRFVHAVGRGYSGILFRSDGRIGNLANGYGIIVAHYAGRVFADRWTDGADDQFFNTNTASGFVVDHEYEVYGRIRGASPAFDIRITDLTTGAVIFDVPDIVPDNPSPISGPGKVGLLINSGPSVITRATVSELSVEADIPILNVSPATATAGSGVNTVQITATLENSSAPLTASVAGGGSPSTTTPTSGVPFIWTKPGSGSGTATVTVAGAGKSDTCVIAYAANAGGGGGGTKYFVILKATNGA